MTENTVDAQAVIEQLSRMLADRTLEVAVLKAQLAAVQTAPTEETP
ncbi:MAG: hypothetical protein WCN81_00060 [Actinomycetes bacterium]